MRNLTLTTTNLSNVPPIIDIVDDLPRKMRWEELKKPYRHMGAWDRKTYHTGFRKAEDISGIVIHHAGSEGTLEAHAKNHIKKWGAGLSYHIAIEGNQIYQTNDLLSFTYHVGNHNTYTVGIVINRDLSKGDLTTEERHALYAAILAVKAVLPIRNIYGHNELNPTACPCTNVQRIRQDIADIEEKLNIVIPEKNRAVQAFSRMLDLKKKLESDGPHKEEAMRKLLIIDEAIREKGFYL
jgi:N-acetylmuramoyl-L-alanine amidase CwlA